MTPITENQDAVFKDEIQKPADFKFNKSVVSVFDDMVSRSVPFYGEMQRMVAELAADFVQDHTDVYDLGCSTGTTLIGLNSLVKDSIKFVGLDESMEMLDKCHKKLVEAGFTRPFELRVADLQKNPEISNASVVVMCLTLQFIRPIYREKLLKQIYDGLVPGGAFILIEKVLAEDSLYNRGFIKYYYDYKRRNQYSELEISQKREALENVLIPYKLSENVLLLREAGFQHTETFFKWYNFSGVIAQKNQ
jgi:tRNA (cmo5U34)-methyltransferase